MIWIFPIAGQGTRTAGLGTFKPFIPVLDRCLIAWCLRGIRNLVTPEDRFVFITTEAFEREFQVNRNLERILAEEGLPERMALQLAPDTPPGPAGSVRLAAPALDEDLPCTVINADQLIVFETLQISASEGYMPLHVNTTGASSYVAMADGRITNIYEKEMLTHYASSGVYVVGSGRRLLSAIEAAFRSGLSHHGEYYVGPALNHFLEQGGTLWPTRTFLKFDLGSLGGIERFSRVWPTLHGAGMPPGK